jgi:hypothetical protein
MGTFFHIVIFYSTYTLDFLTHFLQKPAIKPKKSAFLRAVAGGMSPISDHWNPIFQKNL